MDQNTKDVLDAIDFIKERMTTKDDLQQFATKDEVRMIVREELRDVRSPTASRRLAPSLGRCGGFGAAWASIEGRGKSDDEFTPQCRERIRDMTLGSDRQRRAVGNLREGQALRRTRFCAVLRGEKRSARR